MKTIFINGRFLTQRITGVQRFAWEVLISIDFLLGKNKLKNLNFEILAPKGITIDYKFKNIKLKEIGFLKGHVWEQLILPLYSFSRPLLSLCNTGPIFKRRHYIVIHDAAVFANPGNFSFLFRIYYKFLFKFLSVFSFKIFTVSDFSKNELIKYLKINSNKIVQIYEGHEHILRINSDYSILNKHDIKPNTYLLGVSSLNKNKNLNSVIKAFQNLNLPNFTLVLAGGINSKIFKTEIYPKVKNVKFLGYVSDPELRCLYENAKAFIFPSLYEGFGLPVLEAMACGCPVITSKNSSMTEIAKEYAIYCDPKSVSSIKNAISNAIEHNFDFREEFKTQLNNFSWSNTSKMVLQEFLNDPIV